MADDRELTPAGEGDGEPSLDDLLSELGGDTGGASVAPAPSPSAEDGAKETDSDQPDDEAEFDIFADITQDLDLLAQMKPEEMTSESDVSDIGQDIMDQAESELAAEGVRIREEIALRFGDGDDDEENAQAPLSVEETDDLVAQHAENVADEGAEGHEKGFGQHLHDIEGLDSIGSLLDEVDDEFTADAEAPELLGSGARDTSTIDALLDSIDEEFSESADSSVIDAMAVDVSAKQRAKTGAQVVPADLAATEPEPPTLDSLDALFDSLSPEFVDQGPAVGDTIDALMQDLDDGGDQAVPSGIRGGSSPERVLTDEVDAAADALTDSGTESLSETEMDNVIGQVIGDLEDSYQHEIDNIKKEVAERFGLDEKGQPRMETSSEDSAITVEDSFEPELLESMHALDDFTEPLTDDDDLDDNARQVLRSHGADDALGILAQSDAFRAVGSSLGMNWQEESLDAGGQDPGATPDLDALLDDVGTEFQSDAGIEDVLGGGLEEDVPAELTDRLDDEAPSEEEPTSAAMETLVDDAAPSPDADLDALLGEFGGEAPAEDPAAAETEAPAADISPEEEAAVAGNALLDELLGDAGSAGGEEPAPEAEVIDAMAEERAEASDSTPEHAASDEALDRMLDHMEQPLSAPPEESQSSAAADDQALPSDSGAQPAVPEPLDAPEIEAGDAADRHETDVTLRLTLDAHGREFTATQAALQKLALVWDLCAIAAALILPVTGWLVVRYLMYR